MLAMVFRRAIVLAALGIAGGLVIAPLAAQVLTGLLYGIRPTDPISLAGTAAALALVAALAAIIPAIRASRIEPAGLMPPDEQLCPSALLTATAASGTSAAASAAAFTCFNCPCSSACVFWRSSVSLTRDIHILLWGPLG